jgi:uncharacterized membrane protein YhaH (DUF805 family)
MPVSFGEAVRSVFANYAKFDGRASRAEYWWFQLFNVLVVLVIYVGTFVGVVAARGSTALLAVGLAVLGIYVIAILIPSLAVTVRRLHDTDRSGWWLLIALVPYVGAFILLIFTLLQGTQGINQFGPPPGMAGDVRRVNYRALTPEETWARYTEDAQRAAANGYRPVSQTWRRDGMGDYLEVFYTTYQEQWQPGGAGWQAPGQVWQAPPPGPMGAANAGRHPFDGPPPDTSGGA